MTTGPIVTVPVLGFRLATRIPVFLVNWLTTTVLMIWVNGTGVPHMRDRVDPTARVSGFTCDALHVSLSLEVG